MKKTAPVVALLALALLVAGTAWAQHDETSEPNASTWAVGGPTPGVGPAGSSLHLLISELVVTPTTNEFIEIHNPTASAVDLTDYYLSDAWFEGTVPFPGYHRLPEAPGAMPLGTNTDFVVKFPNGASIAAGATIVVAFYGQGVDSTFGASTVDYVICNTGHPAPLMVSQVATNPPTANATGLTNGQEFVVLFRWDGASDLVCDVDYVTWGTAASTSRVDKTGVTVDGPDGDAIASAYANDTADASQSASTAPGAGSSTARTSGAEGAESSGGNGCALPPVPGMTAVASGVAGLLLAVGGMFAVRRRRLA